MKNRQPIRAGTFLVHGEEGALAAFSQRLAGFLPPERIVVPRIDGAFELTAGGAIDISETRPPRIDPARPGHKDWHNDLQSLVLDLQEELAKAGDDKARAVIIRRLRRALGE